MKRRLLPFLLLAGAAAPPPPVVVTTDPPSAPPFAASSAPALGQRPRPMRLPSFAPQLADAARINGPRDWSRISPADALSGIAASRPADRQAARWRYASSLIASRRVPEALGVLDVMLQDDPDLGLVDNFQLARGLALASLGRAEEAYAALDRDGLRMNAEACLWRMKALAGFGARAEALDQLPCAGAALAARTREERTSFLVLAADAALFLNRPEAALRLLGGAPSREPAANLRRSRAHLKLGQGAEARLALGRAGRSGNAEQRMDARVTAIEAAVANRALTPQQALARLEAIRFVWRGDQVEERALRLSYRLARDIGDVRKALAAGAALVRYHRVGAELPALMRDLQASLAVLLAPDSTMPIDQAAGLYWDYRDLTPGGAEGDALVTRLADRLQALSLYSRAAELLEHQLTIRARDVVQGPLSVRVAKLHILAGRPDRALAALQASAQTLYPQAMLWDRQRVEAVALHQMGRGREALAVLDEVPGTGGLRSELLWKQRNWQALAAAAEADLAAPAALNELRQAIILRYAIALGMLGREEDLAVLRSRYAPEFAPLPTARAFDLLTREAGAIDAVALAEAMAAIPTVSPAGELADLMELAPASQTRG